MIGGLNRLTKAFRFGLRLGGSRDEPTAQALVRPFFMVMRDVLAHELSEMRLAQWDHAVEAFLLDRTVEPLDECIQVWAAPGQANWLDTDTREACAKFLSKGRIAVHDQIAVRQQEPVHAVGQVAQDLEHPVFVGLLDDTRNLNSPALEVHHNEHVVPHWSAKGQQARFRNTRGVHEILE